jgi:CO/xanthine dehydrogenase Mo-binding subunit
VSVVSPVPTRTSPHQVGRVFPRVDAGEKLRGEARFVGDMKLPGMLHGRIVRSTVPHARIVSIDTSEAEELEGVATILTGRDLLDMDPYFGHAIKDRPIVAMDKVRFAGEPVAAVAAVGEAVAARAAALIEIEYEELPLAADLRSALSDDAPEIHSGPTRAGLFHGLGELPEREGNICYSYGFERGDVAAAFERAGIVVEGEYLFPAVYQYAMETHTVIAHWSGEEVTVWATCQHPFLVRAEIADLFGMALDRVRIIVPYVGGGFGSKSYTKMEPVTVALARKAGAPVRIQNRIDDSMQTTRRHNMRCRMRTAADSDGRLIGREVKIWLDTGAYADNGPRVTATAGDAAPGPYRWPAVQVDADCVYTNTSPAGSYRAFGAAHLQWIGEMQVDDIARRAGVDPLEMRHLNLLRPGEEVRPGGKTLDADLVGDVQRAAAAIGWGEPKEPGIGRGVSVGLLAAGAHPVSSAVLRLDADGRAVVLVGSTELGQGARTVFAQIAAEELGCNAEVVTVKGTDTRFTPYDRSTGASRSTTLAGLAVQRAAADLKSQLFEIAAAALGVDASELTASGGAMAAGDRSLTYVELIQKRFGFSGGQLIGRGEVHPHGSGSYVEGPVFWEVCVGAAEVEVDPDTGMVTVRKMATVADVGRAINPLLVARQDEGATMQGLGNALFEEMIWADGFLTNDNLLEYRVPTFMDVPAEMTCIVVENEDGPGPFGAKGCGEGALAATPGAVATALADAGVPMNELPLTPERVWRRMRELRKEE